MHFFIIISTLSHSPLTPPPTFILTLPRVYPPYPSHPPLLKLIKQWNCVWDNKLTKSKSLNDNNIKLKNSPEKLIIKKGILSRQKWLYCQENGHKTKFNKLKKTKEKILGKREKRQIKKLFGLLLISLWIQSMNAEADLGEGDASPQGFDPRRPKGSPFVLFKIPIVGWWTQKLSKGPFGASIN